MQNIDKDGLIIVAGGGGFIGGHLISNLLNDGYIKIRSVDVKNTQDWYQRFDEVDNVIADLRDETACRKAVRDAQYIFNLACDMGGMGFIETHKVECMLSVQINVNLLKAAHDYKVERYFFSSSACVYNAEKQAVAEVTALRESDAYPAMPEDGYGWEKLFSERLCRHFFEDCGLTTRVARYHNVYGPSGTYDGGREKAPAAICRKVITAKLAGNNKIEIWGNGEQTRSFMEIRDCIEGTKRIFESSVSEPLNLGSSQLVTINRLVDIIEAIAGVTLQREYILDAPKGVQGRNSDNTMIQDKLGWAPGISLEEGLEDTYRWIYDQIVESRAC